MLADRVRMGSGKINVQLVPCTFIFEGFIMSAELLEDGVLVLPMKYPPNTYEYECKTGVEYNFKPDTNYDAYYINNNRYPVSYGKPTLPVELGYITLLSYDKYNFKFIIHSLPAEGITIKAVDSD